MSAVPLANDLPVEKDRAPSRLKVAEDLSLPGFPEVFAIGDIAHVVDAAGKVVPGVSPAAMQMGRHVGQVIKRRVEERKPPVPFRYFDKGSMATIGRSRAVAQVGPMRFSGFTAWLAWLFVHLIFSRRFPQQAGCAAAMVLFLRELPAREPVLSLSQRQNIEEVVPRGPPRRTRLARTDSSFPRIQGGGMFHPPIFYLCCGPPSPLTCSLFCCVLGGVG